VPPEEVAVASGTVRDANGQAIAGQPVTLTVGDQKFVASTDASGRYAFYASTIKQGTGTVETTVGGVRVSKPVQPRGPNSSADLRATKQ
jgi:hypothetical protein